MELEPSLCFQFPHYPLAKLAAPQHHAAHVRAERFGHIGHKRQEENLQRANHHSADRVVQRPGHPDDHSKRKKGGAGLNDD